MKFTVDRVKFAEVVASVAQGLPARPVNLAHLGMLVQADDILVQVVATDGQTTFQNVITSEDTLTTPGGFIFPKIFPDMIRSLAGKDVTVAVEGLTGTVTSGRSVFTFPVQPGEDFPFPALDVPELGRVDGPEFRMALRKVLAAADKDNPLPALTAIMLRAGPVPQSMQLVATDRYLLACADVPFSCEHTATTLLPARQAERIMRMDGTQMTVGWDDGRIQVRSDGFSITCRSIQGEFPKQWEMILSPGGNWHKLPDDLADVVKRAALTLGDKEPVRLDFGGELTVSSPGEKGTFTEALPWEYNGEPVIARVGPGMLASALAWCDQVSVGRGRPLLLRGEYVRYLVQVRRGDGKA